jgi:TP901 family phage tail tape measure protein
MAVVIPIIADVKGLASGVDDAQKHLNRLGKNVGKLGTSMTKNMTLPILGLGAASLVAFNEVDKGLDAVAVGTGATGEALKELQGTFKAVAANSTQGMKEVGEVVAEVNTRLGLAGKPLEDFSERMLTLARVTGVDAVAATKSITRAMNDAGVKVEDAGGFMDILLVASQKTGIGVNELADKLVKFGSPMRQLGFSVEETAALLGEFEKAGVNTDLVMGSLRIGLGKLAKAGEKDLPAALRASIEEIKNAETGGEAAAKAMELFGSRAGADMAAAIREGRLNVDELVTSLQSADGALVNTAEATTGPQEKLKMLKNQLTLVGASFADVFIPVLEKALGPLQRLVATFQNLSPGMRSFIVTTLAIVAAIGPMLILVAKAIQVYAALRSIIIAVRAAQIGLNLAMIANPIGLIVLAVVALVAAFVIAYKRSEAFREIVDKIGATVRDNLIRAFDWLKRTVNELWPVVQSVFASIKPVLEAIGGVIQTAVTIYVRALSTYIRAWVTVFREAYELIRPVAVLIGGLVKDYIVANVKAVGVAIDVAKAGFNAFKNAVISVRDALAGPLSRIGDMIETSITGAVNGVKTAIRGITGVFEAVISGIQRLWNNTIGGKGLSIPNWVPGLGGSSYTIPKLAKGGIVTSPTIAMIGEAGPEAVVPLGSNYGMGATYNITVNAGMGASGIDLGREIVDAIKKYERTNGNVFAGA